MSYIAPSSTIKLLRNVPINNTYKDSLYFATTADQTEYFDSCSAYTFSEQSYQRINRGRLRVNICADNVYDCNYLMFRNTAFNNKWFYAFIQQIDYVNNVTCEVIYELDVLQTWWFEKDLGECFIERMHTGSDDLYEHYMIENLDMGDYVIDADCYEANSAYRDVFDEKCYVICTVPLDDETYTPCNGYYSQCEYYMCQDNEDSIADFFDNVMSARDAEGVISCYRFFKEFVDKNNDSDTDHDISVSSENRVWGYIGDALTMPTDIGGYEPKNNRLFSYPYTVICVTDNSGNSQYYRPEMFYSDIKFQFKGAFVGSPCVMAVPFKYKCTEPNYNYEEAFTVNGYPMSAVAQDTYEAWLATSGFSNALGVMGGVSSLANGLMTGNVFYAGIGLTGALNAVNQYVVMSGAPNKAVTTDNSDIIDACEMKFPSILIKTVTYEYAKRIDEYFTRYGYSYGRLGTPDAHMRKYFTYVKTQDCDVTGSIPAEDAKKIASIYDKGITFWADPTVVGDYSVDNDTIY